MPVLGELRYPQALLTSALTAAFLSIVLHFFFALHFPPPQAPLNDERYYVTAAARYAEYFWAGTAQKFLFDQYNIEHPVLGKLVYSGAILADWRVHGKPSLQFEDLPQTYADTADEATWNTAPYRQLLTDGRIASATLGVLAVFVLAKINPIAGLFLAVSTPMLVYSSAAFLEASGVLFSVLAMYLTVRLERVNRAGWAAIVCIGVVDGMSIACKYYYGIVLLPILFYFIRLPSRGQLARAWILVLIGTWIGFSLFDLPFFISGFGASSRLVAQNGLQYASGWDQTSQTWMTHWYSELTMLGLGFRSWFYNPTPFLLAIDPIVFGLAIVGAPILLRDGRSSGIWLTAALAFLVMYPVKYPQYTMLGVVPVSWCAGESVRRILGMFEFRGWQVRRRSVSQY